MCDLESFRLKLYKPHHRFLYIVGDNWEAILLIEAITIGDTIESHLSE